MLNLASDLYDTVYVRIDFQAKDGSVFQMFVIDRSIVIGCFDNRIIMFLCELFQGIYVRKLLFTHSFKIYVKLSVLQHKVDAAPSYCGYSSFKLFPSNATASLRVILSFCSSENPMVSPSFKVTSQSKTYVTISSRKSRTSFRSALAA